MTASKGNNINQSLDPVKLLNRVLLVALLLALFNVVILYSVFQVKEKTERMIGRNLALITEARESTEKIVAFIEDRHMLGGTTDPQIDRIYILLSEHDKKLKALQDTNNLLYDVKYGYSTANTGTTIK